MIELSDSDKQWINFCKNRLGDKYPFTNNWIQSMKPMFLDLYGWNPDDDNNYYDFLECTFKRLLDVQLLISESDYHDHHRELNEVFKATFTSNEFELPIERAIIALRASIAFNSVIDDNGSKRYKLD